MKSVSFAELAEYPPGTIFSLIAGTTVAGLWSKGETSDDGTGLASGGVTVAATNLASGSSFTYRQPTRVGRCPDDDRESFSIHEPPDLRRLIDAVVAGASLFDRERRSASVNLSRDAS